MAEAPLRLGCRLRPATPQPKSHQPRARHHRVLVRLRDGRVGEGGGVYRCTKKECETFVDCRRGKPVRLEADAAIDGGGKGEDATLSRMNIPAYRPRHGRDGPATAQGERSGSSPCGCAWYSQRPVVNLRLGRQGQGRDGREGQHVCLHVMSGLKPARGRDSRPCVACGHRCVVGGWPRNPHSRGHSPQRRTPPFAMPPRASHRAAPALLDHPDAHALFPNVRGFSAPNPHPGRTAYHDSSRPCLVIKFDDKTDHAALGHCMGARGINTSCNTS